MAMLIDDNIPPKIDLHRQANYILMSDAMNNLNFNRFTAEMHYYSIRTDKEKGYQS